MLESQSIWIAFIRLFWMRRMSLRIQKHNFLMFRFFILCVWVHVVKCVNKLLFQWILYEMKIQICFCMCWVYGFCDSLKLFPSLSEFCFDFSALKSISKLFTWFLLYFKINCSIVCCLLCFFGKRENHDQIWMWIFHINIFLFLWNNNYNVCICVNEFVTIIIFNLCCES